jgi:hypothetical protein
MRTTLAVLFALITGRASAAVNTPPLALTVVVEPTKITASGVSPGADVLFFGAGYEPEGFHAVFHRWSVVVTETAHGTVSYVFDKPVTWNAVWIVADLRTGKYAVVSTPGFPTMTSEFTRRSLKRDGVGAVNQFIFSRQVVDFVYLAPGGGAWSLLASDGDTTDADGRADGQTTLDLLRANPISGTDRVRQFTPGGTLLAIDPSRLDVLELKLDGSLLAGAR